MYLLNVMKLIFNSAPDAGRNLCVCVCVVGVSIGVIDEMGGVHLTLAALGVLHFAVGRFLGALGSQIKIVENSMIVYV